MGQTYHIALLAINASLRRGGESARPIHYAQGLIERGHTVSLLTHERNIDEFKLDLPELLPYTTFVADTTIQRWAWRLGHWLPLRIREFSVGQIISLCTQRSMLNELEARPTHLQPDIIHQVIPISPRNPSLIRSDKPVVIGPLNGDINYPAAFARREPLFERIFVNSARPLATLLNNVFAGKKDAELILVSNQRTEQALPVRPRGRVETLTANAVDLSQWHRTAKHDERKTVRFAFLGRLVPFKGVDLLLHAFASSDYLRNNSELVIIGDGPERDSLLTLSRKLDIRDRVRFDGWVNHETAVDRLLDCDTFVFPSLQDPGGAVVMEACALGLPVICADWGGPADYLPKDAGFTIPVETRARFIQTLADRMLELCQSSELRKSCGRAARKAAEDTFDWSNRITSLEAHYRTLFEAANARPSKTSHNDESDPTTALPNAPTPAQQRESRAKPGNTIDHRQ